MPEFAVRKAKQREGAEGREREQERVVLDCFEFRQLLYKMK